MQIPQYGTFYDQTVKGNAFVAVSAIAGVVPPIYSNTAHIFGLWNQSVSADLVLVDLTLNCVGTPAVSGNLGFAWIAAGVSIGTPISAGTQATAFVFNRKTMTVAQGNAGKYYTALTVVAPGVYIPVGITSAGVLAAASTTTPWTLLEKNFDGNVIVPPGVCITFCGNVAQTAAFGVTLGWIEVPHAA